MIQYKQQIPSLEEYKKLRDAADWSLAQRGISNERALESLKQSAYCVCAYDGEQIIGMVRMSGDRAMYGYIQDTIVLPRYQKQGIGREMMRILLKNVESLEGYLIGVCPSKVSVRFYESFGLKKRPQDPNGFMSLEITKRAKE